MRLFFFVIGSLALACSSNEGGGDGGGGSAGKAGGGAPSGGSAGNTASGGSSGASGGTSGGGSAAGGASGGSAGNTSGGSGNGGTAGSGGSSGGSSGFSCPAQLEADPVPDGATPTQVAGVPPADNYHENGFQIIEGPVWFQGAVYVSQITQIGSPPKSRVIKILDGTVTVPLNDVGTNGLAIDEMGNLLGARHLDGSISQLDPANVANVTPVIDMHDGARFNCPNDIAVRSDGNLYFSDPDYQAPDPTPQDATRVYRVAPGSTSADVVDESLNNPNGVMLSLDENTLYITHPSGLVQYPINPDGTTAGGTPVNGAPGGDGMGMDCAGNLYMTGGQEIVILGPELTEIDSIAVPGGLNTTNVAFGGPEGKTLYITTLGNNAALWQVELNIPGKPY